MKTTIMLASLLLLLSNFGLSQINNQVTEKINVYGNCSLCKAAIEKAAFQKKVSRAEWDKDSKIATITYDSKKTKLESILKKIALAGYDNQEFLAPDAAYNNLESCCKYERVNKQVIAKTNPEPAHHPATSTEKGHQHKEGVERSMDKEPLLVVIDQYFLLKDALVNTNTSDAAAKSNVLKMAINAVKMENLSNDVHLIWMKVVKELKDDATSISESKNIATQRERFMRLSKNMYDLIKVTKPSTAVYYQFCPMANDGKGANWLSKENTVKNPYYGAAMLTCGSVVETIKN